MEPACTVVSTRADEPLNKRGDWYLMDFIMVDSMTFTQVEAEELVNVLRWAIREAQAHPPFPPDDPRFKALERLRRAVLRKVETTLNRGRRRATARCSGDARAVRPRRSRASRSR